LLAFLTKPPSVRSVSTVTGGSGAYAKATGSGSNDTYVIDYSSNGEPRYGLVSLAERRVTVNALPGPGTLALRLLGGVALLRRRLR
jgi:hypothetical protein